MASKWRDADAGSRGGALCRIARAAARGFRAGRILVVAAALAGVLASAHSAAGSVGQTWNLGHDLQAHATAPAANPFSDAYGNASVWHMMGASGTARDPSTYSEFSTYSRDVCGVSGLDFWGGAFINSTAATINGTPCAPFQVLPPGRAGIHPGPTTLALFGWRSPITGMVSISGGITDADCGGGNGVDWYIARGSTDLASGSIANCGTQSYPAGLSAAVQAGDFLYFIVSPKAGDNAYDSTVVDVTIVMVDGTAPEVTHVVTGTLGNNGWYVSDVSLTWNVSEPESPSSLATTGCNNQNIVADQTEANYSCSASSAGGAAGPVTVSIKRDASNPNINCGTLPNGWQATNVILNCSAADIGPSGLANTGDASFQLATTVPAGSEAPNAPTGSRTIADNAGKQASVGPFIFSIDRKPPVVSCNPAAFLLNQSPAQVFASVSDAGAGPAASVLNAPADTSSVGAKTASLTGYDNVGNSTTVACWYGVAYKFIGFDSPTDNGGILNQAKAGLAIPLKWRLLDANDQPMTSLSSYGLTVTSLTCALGATFDQIEEYATGGSGLQNLGNGYYQVNWKSPTAYAKSCKTLHLDVGEGRTRTALFEFIK
jgi:hypothetical protein